MTWWTDATGMASDQQVANPKQGIFRELGAYQGGTLALGVQPGRVDWVYAAATPEDELIAEILTLGAPRDSIERFRDIARRWFVVGLPVSRLAVGIVLLEPVADRRDAYQHIARYVRGLQLDSDRCSDFLYQINRHRTSTVLPGLRVNRLLSGRR
jgi:hypothetical protein